MKLSALGEFGLIASLSKMIGAVPPNILLGIGDDAAVWRTSSGYEIATCDILIEDVHFTLATCPWFDLGWKAMAVNVSDVAAMGGLPRYALLSIGLPPAIEAASVHELYRGATKLCQRFGVAIVGGDTVRSPKAVVISPAVVGEASLLNGRVHLLRRDRARPGDLVGVTGALGASAGGLELLMHPGSGVSTSCASMLRDAHLHPVPLVEEAQVLLAAGVEAAMDVSDGLVGDLRKLCLASGLSATVDLAKVPVAAALRAAMPDRALDLALYGGEDYALLFSAPEGIFRDVQNRLNAAGLQPATEVGYLSHGEAGAMLLRDAEGHVVAPARAGYDAFLD